MNEALREYLFLLAKEGYAKDPGTRNEDGSMTIKHSDGDWSTVDTYWGGEPYSGCETVSHKGKPYWSMVYYGNVAPSVTDVNSVYGLLRTSLANTDEELPLRGPKEFAEGKMVYRNHWHGTLERFEGKERILENEAEIYIASYMGGLVNQREE